MAKDKKIAIVVGSRTDFKLFISALEKLKELSIPFEFTIASAHRTPERLRQWLEKMEQAGIEVIIAGAGGAAHLPGVVASHTSLPVIGVPLDTTHLRGVDALYSIVQMPQGVPVATVGINNVMNAVLLAFRILGIKYPEYQDLLAKYKKETAERIDEHIAELKRDYPELLGNIDTLPAVGSVTSESNDSETKPEGKPIPKGKDDLQILRELERDFEEFSRKLREEKDKIPKRTRKPRKPIESISLGESYKEKKSRSEEQKPSPVQQKPRIFKVNPLNPEPEIIEEASVVLLEGGVVALPTDTVYGISADATNQAAVRRLYQIKSRELTNPIPVLIHTVKQLSSLVKRYPESIRPLIERFWPGALTLVFEKYKDTFTALSCDTTIGVRIPNNLISLSVLSMVARPLATTSANISGHPPATTAEKVIEYFGEQVDVVLDGGPTHTETVSTVLSVIQEPFTILREGEITREMLLEILGEELLK